MSTSAIPGVPNLRELGGLRTVDGRTVRRGVLYRAELLTDTAPNESNATWVDDDLPAYAALGLRTVIDLRYEEETRVSPSRWARATDADYVGIPIDDGVPGSPTDLMAPVLSGRRRDFTIDDMKAYYVSVVDGRRAEFARAVEVIADPGRLPVLVHCSAGKDRTGITIALVLSAIGVDRETVLDDYAETEVRRPDRALLYRETFARIGVDVEAVRVMFETPRAALAAALDRIEERDGSVTGYLRAAGVSEATLEALRDALLEDAA